VASESELRALVRPIVQAAPFGDEEDGQIGRAWKEFLDAYGAQAERVLALEDRYFLLTVLCKRADMAHPWLYARCREVEAQPDGRLDLWAREHYKSTIITFGGIVQEILRDPEITVGIFSHSFSVAKAFLQQIKREFESNQVLKNLFPEVLWQTPGREAPSWSIDGGIVVRRKSNPKEPTVMASGLVDGMPTGAHFKLRVYDDVVTEDSVTTPEQIEKTTNMWSLSDNLGARGPDGTSRSWHAGTRYSFADSYQTMLDMKALVPRIYPATHDGTPDGKPVFMSEAAWAQKRSKQVPSVLACQQLLNPAAGNEAIFDAAWLRYAEIRPATLNVYIMADPASSRKKGSDRTAIPVIGIDAAGNKYLLDGYHHRMKLPERWDCIRGLRRTWMNTPGVQMVKVGYERYGMQSDLDYFEEQMLRDRDSFEITELAWPREGPGSKIDRIQRLVPDWKNGKLWLPKLCVREVDGRMVEYETSNQTKMREISQSFRILKPTRRRDEEGNLYSLNHRLLEEYMVFPFSAHDDFLDAMSRIYDMEPVPPIIIEDGATEPEVYADGT
jgi:hypothetical protein